MITKCTASYGECAFHNSINIWNQSIILKICPFYRIVTVNLDDYYLSKDINIFVQVKSDETQSGIKMITTTEGLYLIPHIPANEHVYKELDKILPL
jgi:hypothetical protein